MPDVVLRNGQLQCPKCDRPNLEVVEVTTTAGLARGPVTIDFVCDGCGVRSKMLLRQGQYIPNVQIVWES